MISLYSSDKNDIPWFSFSIYLPASPIKRLLPCLSVGKPSADKSTIYVFRAKCAAMIMGNVVVAIGGCAEDERCEEINLKTAEYLVIGEKSWKRLPPMHCERAGAAACFLP
jgi:hypothetical protein